MKRWSILSAALAATSITALSSVASASSHSEAPGTASDAEIDNTDTWAFVNGDNLVIVAGYNGLWDHAAPNYKKFATEGARYAIHIARGGADLDPDLEYVFEFKEKKYAQQDAGDLKLGPLDFGGKEFFSQLSGGGAWAQTYTVTKVEKGNAKVVATGTVAPPNVGPRTNAALNAVLGGGQLGYEERWVDNAGTSVVKNIAAGDGGGKVFAGPRSDAFYVDLGAVFDLAGLPDVGGVPELGADFGPDSPFNPEDKTATRAHAAARSSTNYRNVMAITLSIPIETANGGALKTTGGTGAGPDDLVGVWASASRQKVTILRKDGGKDTHGPYRQVSRLGLPLINEAVIGLQDKDRWNGKRPKDDVPLFGAYFLNPVIVRDAQGVGLYSAGGVLNGIGCGTSADGTGPVASTANGLGLPSIPDLRTNRTDIVATINLGYDIPLTATGDVLRVDLSNPDDLLGNAGFSIPTSVGSTRVTENRGAFPNGRRLNLAQEADVTDIELTLLLCGLPFIADTELGGGGINGGIVGDRVSRIAHDNRATFPYLAAPVAQSDVRASTAPGDTAMCGDGTCAAEAIGGNETASSCPADCGGG
jgi:hypothetical protein